MNDFICQTSNKTYHHVSTVKLDVSISCGTPDLDAHAEKMGNPVVVFHDVATDCGQQMVLYVVNYLLLLLLKHNHSASNYITSVWRLKHNKSVHGHLIFITQRIIMSYRKWKKIIIKFLGLQFSRQDPIFQKLMGPRTPFWKCLAPTLSVTYGVTSHFKIFNNNLTVNMNFFQMPWTVWMIKWKCSSRRALSLVLWNRSGRMSSSTKLKRYPNLVICFNSQDKMSNMNTI